MKCARPTPNGGSAPATPGFNAVAPECSFLKGRPKPPLAIPAAESTLGSHPCVALSSAQVLPEWINRNPAVDHFPSDGYNPLNFVSQPRGSLHSSRIPPLPTTPWKSRKTSEIPTFPQLRRRDGGKVENQKQVSHFPTAFSWVERRKNQKPPTASAKKKGTLLSR